MRQLISLRVQLLLFVDLFTRITQIACDIPQLPLALLASSHQDLPEPHQIELPMTPSRLGGTWRWSASFTAQHRVILRGGKHYRLHANCPVHLLDADAQLESVAFNYIYTSYYVEEVELLLNASSIPDNRMKLFRWPKFDGATGLTKAQYFPNRGATIDLEFPETKFSLTGNFQCRALITKIKGHSNTRQLLRSMIVPVTDMKLLISQLSIPAELYDGYVTQLGATHFSSAQDHFRERLLNLSLHEKIKVGWGLGKVGLDKYERIVVNMDVQLFRPMDEIEKSDLGQYVIDAVGNLYVNWESPRGIALRKTLINAQNAWDPEERQVLLMNSYRLAGRTSLGDKFYQRFYWRDTGMSLPLRVEPQKNYSEVLTFVGNTDDTLRCTFLANKEPNKTLSVSWLKDGLPLNLHTALGQQNVLRKYGIRPSQERSPYSILELRDVTLAAAGEWTCILYSGLIAILNASYKLQVMAYPRFSSSVSLPPMAPAILFALQGDVLRFTCSLTSFNPFADHSKQSVLPNICINGLPHNGKLHRSNDSFHNFQSTLELPLNNNVTQLLITCTANGQFPWYPGDVYRSSNELFNVEVMRSIFIQLVPPISEQSSFAQLPKHCNISYNDRSCNFSCEISPSYLSRLKSLSVRYSLTWRIVGETNQLRNGEAKFIQHGPQLSIVASTYLFTLIHQVVCVVQFHYEASISNDQLRSIELSKAPNNKKTLSSTQQASLFYAIKDVGDKALGPAFYSSEMDQQMSFLIANIKMITTTAMPTTTPMTTQTTTITTTTTTTAMPTTTTIPTTITIPTTTILTTLASSPTTRLKNSANQCTCKQCTCQQCNCPQCTCQQCTCRRCSCV